MFVIITKIGNEIVSAITWTKTPMEGLQYARSVAKQKGYVSPKVFIA